MAREQFLKTLLVVSDLIQNLLDVALKATCLKEIIIHVDYMAWEISANISLCGKSKSVSNNCESLKFDGQVGFLTENKTIVYGPNVCYKHVAINLNTVFLSEEKIIGH